MHSSLLLLRSARQHAAVDSPRVLPANATSSGDLHLCQEDISEEALTARMRRLLEPFLLRRLKEQVASQLVPKQQQVCANFHMLMRCRKQSQDKLACELVTMSWITH